MSRSSQTGLTRMLKVFWTLIRLRNRILASTMAVQEAEEVMGPLSAYGEPAFAD